MQPRRFTVPLPGGRSLALGERTLVMGIVNVTPDSFSDGGVLFDAGRAVDAAMQMVEQGRLSLDQPARAVGRPDGTLRMRARFRSCSASWP